MKRIPIPSTVCRYRDEEVPAGNFCGGEEVPAGTFHHG